MQNEPGIRDVSRLLDQLSIPESSADLAGRYQNSLPFPHLTIDNLFNSEQLTTVLNEMSQTRKSDWVHHNTQYLEKLGLKSAAALGPAGFQLVALLHSAPFLYLLSEITGIWNLLPDPYMHGAGYSIIPPKGKFDVHIDSNADITSGLIRRLALIIYLNHDWSPEYGGQLELWNKDATRKEVEIEPIFNRTLLMEISETTYHGINPVVEPSGRSRYSFMIYYNTAGRILGKELGVHSSMYAPDCYRPKPTVRSLVRMWTPPVFYDFVRQRIR
jgi:2OG-Fe(II) oxygenase superfamily